MLLSKLLCLRAIPSYAGFYYWRLESSLKEFPSYRLRIIVISTGYESQGYLADIFPSPQNEHRSSSVFLVKLSHLWKEKWWPYRRQTGA